MRQNPISRVHYDKFLEFSASGLAYICRDENVRGNRLLPRSIFGHLVGMAIDTVVIKVFIPQTATIINVRRSDFRLGDESSLPGHCKELAKEQKEVKELEHETNLM